MTSERFETIKSGLLLLLVALSIGLSIGLWNNTPVFEPVDQGGYIANPVFGVGKTVEQVLLPVRIQVRFEDKSGTVLHPFTKPYEQAWEELKKLALRELVPVDNPESIKQLIRSGPHIEFRFRVGMNEEQIAQVLKMVEPNSFHMKVSSITVFRDSAGTSHLVLSEGDQPMYRGRVAAPSRLFEYVPEWITLPKSVEHNDGKRSFWIPHEKMTVPVLTYEKAMLPTDALARTFFVDPTLTRRIQERDGSLIVTDGNRTVQISSKGKQIRYSSSLPYDKPQQTIPKDNSFQRAVAFVNEHGGMQGSYIGSLQTVWAGSSREYLFTEYEAGLPVLPQFTGIRVILNGNEVVEMSRNLLYLGARVKEELVEIQPPHASIVSQAGELYLAYAPKEADGRIRLFPVWVVESERTSTMMFDAQTGEKWQNSGE
ncbi:two-component system activity regulator YycH [Effusibacillus consociatus]|uniref:Two-component system activity regulator YycH n=1 Tax=Effusibacillus consociatus TaxID=1117041 RepID=A0ABV9PWF0_9BACL